MTRSDRLFDEVELAERMDEGGYGVVIATRPPNVQHLTRYRRPTNALALVRREGMQPVLIVPVVELDFCLEDWDDTVEIQAYGSFPRFRSSEGVLSKHEELIADLHDRRMSPTDPWKVANHLLANRRIESMKIGLDTDPALVAKAAALPAADLADASGLFRQLRSVKTAEEVGRLSEAARITEVGIEASIGIVREGMTQREMAHAFSSAIIQSDAHVRSDNVSIGYGTVLGNVNVPDTAVEDGSVIRFDVGCFYGGYSSDVARTFIFKQPSPKVESYYAALLKGQDRILEMLRPGVRASEIFHAAVETVRAGIPHYERAHVGHGIGIAGAGYDAPLLGPNDETLLQEGMVLCVETPYFEFGFAGLQVEDMVVITDTGFNCLTNSSRELRVLN